MKTPKKNLEGATFAPIDMAWYERKAKKMLDDVDAWLEHHEAGCKLMARIFSTGERDKDLQFFVLVEKNGVYYPCVEAANEEKSAYGTELETGLRPGMPINAGKYKQGGEKYLAFALCVSANGLYIHLHDEGKPAQKAVPETVKVQAYLTPEQVAKLDAECGRLQMIRAAEIRPLLEALPD